MKYYCRKCNNEISRYEDAFCDSLCEHCNKKLGKKKIKSRNDNTNVVEGVIDVAEFVFEIFSD